VNLFKRKFIAILLNFQTLFQRKRICFIRQDWLRMKDLNLFWNTMGYRLKYLVVVQMVSLLKIVILILL
jgi:hypothetical protein